MGLLLAFMVIDGLTCYVDGGGSAFMDFQGAYVVCYALECVHRPFMTLA